MRLRIVIYLCLFLMLLIDQIELYRAHQLMERQRVVIDEQNATIDKIVVACYPTPQLVDFR